MLSVTCVALSVARFASSCASSEAFSAFADDSSTEPASNVNLQNTSTGKSAEKASVLTACRSADKEK